MYRACLVKIVPPATARTVAPGLSMVRFFGAQDFRNLEWQVATTDKQIVDAIRTGPGPMPAFADRIIFV